MTTQIMQNASHPVSAHAERTKSVLLYAERIQDVLLVSSFGLWAALLGFTPVLAYRLLVAA
jgi:hypothetical protein